MPVNTRGRTWKGLVVTIKFSPDVWGFRSHFTHNKGARRRKKKQYKKNGTKSKMALNKQQEKHERQATIQQREQKKEQIVFLLTARCHTLELS